MGVGREGRFVVEDAERSHSVPGLCHALHAPLQCGCKPAVSRMRIGDEGINPTTPPLRMPATCYRYGQRGAWQKPRGGASGTGIRTNCLIAARTLSGRVGRRSPMYRPGMGTARLEVAQAAMARGDLLMAYDAALSEIDEDGTSVRARYLAALALVRMGSVEEAHREIVVISSPHHHAQDVPIDLCEDIDALAARLAKESAFEHSGAEFEIRVREAAAAYAEVAERYGGFYAAVNAATLFWIVGDQDGAVTMASRAMRLAEESPPRIGPWQPGGGFGRLGGLQGRTSTP